MRGIVGLTLSGLGAFFVALALLLHFYVAGQVIKFPLNELSETTFTGHDVSYFSFKQLTPETGVNVRVTQVLEGDVEAGSASTAVWNQFTSIADLTHLQTVRTISRRSAFNRRTGVLVNGFGGYVGSNTAVRQSGQGYLWPIGTQKRTYQVFDPDTLRPEPFRYQGTRPIDGMTAYQFAEHVSNQRMGTVTLPGWLVGAGTTADIKVPEYITEANTVWVDPASGMPVYEVQSQTQLAGYAGATQLVLFRGSIAETPQSAAAAVGAAGSFDLRQQLLQGIGPLAGLLLGLLVLGLGVILARRPAADDQLALAEAPGQDSQQSYRPEVHQPEDAPRLPEAAYPPGPAAYSPGPAAPGYRAGLPGAIGHAAGGAETGYQLPRVPENGRAPGYSRAGQPQLPDGGYQPRVAEGGYEPGLPEGGYPPGYSAEGYWQGPQQPGNLPSRQQPGYPRNQPQPGYPQDRPQPGWQQPGQPQSRPQPGSPQTRPQPPYLPGSRDGRQLPPWHAENSHPPGPPPQSRVQWEDERWDPSDSGTEP